jgi:hypothetical protein
MDFLQGTDETRVRGLTKSTKSIGLVDYGFQEVYICIESGVGVGPEYGWSADDDS